MTKLTQVVRDCFPDADFDMDRTTSAADVEGWDSISHVRLLLMVETAFGVNFDYLERTRFKNIGEMADAIAAKIASA